MKILILGCSLSTNSWILSPTGIKDCRDFESPGWWYALSRKHNYDIRAFIGGGLFVYRDFLQSLGEKLSQYGAVIIQETFDPRVTKLPEHPYDVYTYKNCMLHTYGCNEHPSDKVSMRTNFFLYKATKDIDEILIKFKVPSFVFGWQAPLKSYKWVKSLDLFYLDKLFFYDDRYHLYTKDWFGHLNLDGNIKLGKMVHRKLEEKFNEYK